MQRKKGEKTMSAEEYQKKAQEWLDNQPNRTIDYQWEIQHHNQMHRAYEQGLLG